MLEFLALLLSTLTESATDRKQLLKRLAIFFDALLFFHALQAMEQTCHA
jgi:hypothetical protein